MPGSHCQRFWFNWFWVRPWLRIINLCPHPLPQVFLMYRQVWDFNYITKQPGLFNLGEGGQAKKAMAPHSSTLACKIPWTEEPGGLQSMGSLRVGHDWATSLSCIGEGNGNPLQCFCLENPRDGEAWWTVVYGVIQSRTRLKWLSSSSKEDRDNKLHCYCPC